MGQISKMNKKHAKSGFTMVEVSIATVFISILVITISIIIINVVNIYQKGTVMKGLNSVGRGLVDDITRSIEAASPNNLIGESQNNSNYKWSTYYQSSNADGSGKGVFCSGQYSYVWRDQSSAMSYKYNGVHSFRLIKIKDRNRAVCSAFNPSSDVLDLNGIVDSNKSIEELLSGNEIDFYIKSFHVEEIDGENGTNQTKGNIGEAFFSGDFVLETQRGEKGNMEGDDETLSNCKIDSDEYNYCAINRFKFAARTAGKVF